ncbi:MAG: hypothetical protein F7C38_07405 [Desulfurococcales archaeon]|nr:hypothetical protein [Desulfurococcales archaeon]
MGSKLIVTRTYNAIAALAGGILGVLLGVLSYIGVLNGIDPFVQGLVGLVSSALIGGLSVRLTGLARGEAGRGVVVEAAIASSLATIVVWPIVYSMLGG